MENPHIFGEKTYQAYVSFAVTVAEEPPQTTDHQKRMKVARLLVTPTSELDTFVKTDFINQGYNSNTDQATFNTRLSSLVNIIIKLGFGD